MIAPRALYVWCAAAAMLAAAPARALFESPPDARFDYYVLALSWSPTFCAQHPQERAECGQRRGFVAHGLWPQYAGGGGPEYCGAPGRLDPETLRRARAAMPDDGMIRHEWTVHGSCSGLSPRDYFLTLIRAVGRLAIPPEFDGAAPRSLTASQIVGAFVRSDPSLTERSFALRCRGAQLDEVRICLSRDLHPQACGRGVRTRCPSGALAIPALPSS